MLKIEINGTSAKITLGEHFHYEGSGISPSDAVMNLIFYMESHLGRLGMAEESELTKEAQERMRLLKQFIRKPE